MSYELEVILILDGNDVAVEIEYNITSWGCEMGGPNSYGPGDPPEPPEWEINKMTYVVGPENKELELNWDHLSEEQQQLIEQCVYEDIAERDSDSGYPEPEDY